MFAFNLKFRHYVEEKAGALDKTSEDLVAANASLVTLRARAQAASVRLEEESMRADENEEAAANAQTATDVMAAVLRGVTVGRCRVTPG
jgi:hypothetical protein